MAKKSRLKTDRRPVGEVIWDWTKSLGLALLVALIIRVEVAASYEIPSGSMIPTLQIGDRVLVNKLVYGLTAPLTQGRLWPIGSVKHGDIVVFNPPFDTPEPFIKRVIALPGDTVEIVNKKVAVNGRFLDEPYARFADPRILPASTSPRDNLGPLVVPAGKMFAMGDNRDESNDSRFWGFADLRQVIGRSEVVLWSWDMKHLSLRLKRTLKSTR